MKFILADKVMEIEKFANEIFCHESAAAYAAVQKKSHIRAAGCQTDMGSTCSGSPRSIQRRHRLKRCGEFRIKNA
jgi:hypothetical protein